MNNNQHSPWGLPPDDNEPPPRNSMKFFILTVIVVVVLVFILAWFLSDGLSSDQGAYLAYDFMLLALVGAGLIGHIVSNPGQSLRNMAGWVIIFGVLGLGYSIWNGNGRLASELNPAAGEFAEGAITFRADLSGHYFIRAEVNGVEIGFMVDTGATHIVLNKADAEKIGFDIERLDFNMPASTANGVVYSAAVNLGSVTVGPIRIENIDGYVNQGELGVSLLGMSFLNRLSGYEVRDGLLTLYP
jgi:aspartyl protease family protein|tara:strand:+ start:149007 stop:149738 length:732 start_codon:yes stop_codon:yes gene_type:complete